MTTEKREITEELLDEVARSLIPGLTAIADKQPTTERPYSCEVYQCHRPAGFRAWVLYFAGPDDTEPTQDVRALCKSHAEGYAIKHQARKLTVAGRPVIRYVYRWGLGT